MYHECFERKGKKKKKKKTPTDPVFSPVIANKHFLGLTLTKYYQY